MIAAGFRVIADQWLVIVGILVLILSSQVVVISVIKKIFGRHLTSIEYSVLGLTGWILPASLISILWITLGFQSTGRYHLFIPILIVVGVLCLSSLKTDLGPDPKLTSLFLLLFLSVSIVLRLAFVSRAILPSYFDSAQHYTFIRNILEQGAAAVFTLPASYYHMGFHVFTAFVVSALQTEITRTMLILGQIILAIMPVSVFFLIGHQTKSNWAGLFAAMVSAYGWYMPAHVTDWGKYPALMSVGLMPFGLSLAYLWQEYKDIVSKNKQLAFYGIFGISLFISGFMHSRSVVVMGLAILAWMTAAWQQRLSARQQAFRFSIVLVAILLESIFIQKQGLLAPLFDPYIHRGILITALILFLSIFAQRSYPHLAFTCILFICLLLGSVYVPIPKWIPGYNNLTLLDRPFVEMILYLPLSLLGGLGLAGLEEFFGQRQIRLISQNHYTSMAAISLVLMNAFATYDPYPSNCCVIVGNDDVLAMAWMEDQLPLEARIGIASTELKVMASNSFEGVVGSDAGIWITPLTDRKTIPLPVNSDFGQQATLTRLCQIGISHLYVGELGQHFNKAQLNGQPAWYQILLSMPKVKVYQVVGCKGS